MTFLHPVLFWALPLIFLPVVIHLLNRLRHRPQPWAAMRFLVSATRSSVNNIRLRQFLILLLRVLCVLMLVLFLARPLAGGWLGWALSPAPDAIVILLDRSASMETQIGGVTKREQALKLISEAARDFEQSSHLVLIDSATRTPQELAKASGLNQLSVTGPSDTAADIPALFNTAFSWLIENRAGTAEIWIASDGQRSNWLPDDPRWKNIITQLGSLSKKVRVRFLMLNQPPQANAAISLKEVIRRQRGDKSELQFVLDLQRNRISAAPVPVTLNLDGAHSQSEVAMDGQALRWRQHVDLGARPGGGWGSFELPADSNRRDNTAYFAFGPNTPLHALIVSSDPETSRFLQLASASGATLGSVMPEAGFTSAALTDASLIVWQEALPTGATADRLRGFVQEGGVVIFYPPGYPGAQKFNTLSWGDLQDAEADKTFRIARWDEDQGPLARSDERLSLPLAQVSFIRRQAIAGPQSTLAAFEDGSPFLVRQVLGRGEVYFCTSLPSAEWSSLGDGTVLVPMMQRLLLAGGRRLQQVSSIVCGELSAADASKTWTCLDSTTPKDIRTQAGVYRSGERLMAVNRPVVEDEPEILEMDDARKLFGSVHFQPFQERRGEGSPLQGEIWRMFLFTMLLGLIVEGILILPSRKPTTTPPRAP